MVYVGTSGYSYDDWVGRFYPVGIAKSQFLEFYAQHFNCVEVNYTYYRMPDPRTLEAMSRKTGPGFRFVVKVPGELTHERSGRAEAFEEFRRALAPLINQGKLGAVLAQFPHSFRPGEESYGHLRQLSEEFAGLRMVAEFRHVTWVGPDTLDLLRRLGVGFCCVDEPRLRSLMPPVAEVTSPVAYVRFHGRNARQWFNHQEAWQRYDYLYTREELAEWVPKVRALAQNSEVCFIFFNNHYNAQAVQNAQLFTELLGNEGLL